MGSQSLSDTTWPQAAASNRSGLTRWFRRQPKWFAGIDIGLNRIEVAILKAPKPDGSRFLRWVLQHRIELPTDSYDDVEPNHWLAVITETLKQQLPRCVDGQTAATSVSLPTSWLHYQTEPFDSRAVVEQQCDQIFLRSAFSSKARMTQWPIDLRDIEDSKQYQFAAASTTAISHIAEAISDAGFRVESVVPPTAAVLQAGPQILSVQPAAVILLNRDAGLITLSGANQCGLTRTFPAPTIPRDAPLSQAHLQSWLAVAADEFQATARFASRFDWSTASQTPVLIAGEFATVDEIDAELAKKLRRPVGVWRSEWDQRPRSIEQDWTADADRCVAMSLAVTRFQSHTAPGKLAVTSENVK